MKHSVNVRKLEEEIELLKIWLARVNVGKVIFLALIGIKIWPGLSTQSYVIPLIPIFLYVFIEEIKIRIESRIRIKESLLLKVTNRQKGRRQKAKSVNERIARNKILANLFRKRKAGH